MDTMMEGGSFITLDENNQVKIVEGTPIRPTRYRNIYGTLNTPSKPELPESSEDAEISNP